MPHEPAVTASIRSALYPLAGRRIYGSLGHEVDLAEVLGTIFGIATSLGSGVALLNYGAPVASSAEPTIRIWPA